MTELLEQVIAQLKTLPDEEQNAIAARLLAEMAEELFLALDQQEVDHD